LHNCPEVQALIIHVNLACWQVQSSKVDRPSLYAPEELFGFWSLTVRLRTRSAHWLLIAYAHSYWLQWQ